MEDSSAEREGISLGDEQGDQGDLVKGSQDGQMKTRLGRWTAKPLRKVGKNLVDNPQITRTYS